MIVVSAALIVPCFMLCFSSKELRVLYRHLRSHGESSSKQRSQVTWWLVFIDNCLWDLYLRLGFNYSSKKWEGKFWWGGEIIKRREIERTVERWKTGYFPVNFISFCHLPPRQNLIVFFFGQVVSRSLFVDYLLHVQCS